MSKHTTASRRKFLQGGALLAAPMVGVAAASASALALSRAGSGGDALKARLALLTDEAAIRELHQSWLRRVNAGEAEAVPGAAVHKITADATGSADRIEIAAGGRSAVGHFDCAVELESPLAADSTLARTLVEMVHAQGHGAVRRTERRRLTVAYIKAGTGWKIESTALTAQ